MKLLFHILFIRTIRFVVWLTLPCYRFLSLPPQQRGLKLTETLQHNFESRRPSRPIYPKPSEKITKTQKLQYFVQRL